MAHLRHELNILARWYANYNSIKGGTKYKLWMFVVKLTDKVGK